MSSTATTTTTATKKDRSSSSASQKFWPLKKFGLHHGKADEQQQIPLSETLNKANESSTAASAETNAKVVNEKKNTATITTPEQKKSKNKRLSSLLSSNRRQEGNTQSHVNAPDSNSDINGNSKKQNTTNTSNTPTLTKKAGREIANKSRATATTITTSAKQQNMTAKSAGSGTLARSTTYNNRSLRGSKTARKIATFEDKVVGNRRPQSPLAKRNDSPTQPNIMLESVQQQMQLESNSNEEDSCLEFEEDDSKSDCEDDKLYMIDKNTTINTSVKGNIAAQQPNPELVILNEIEDKAKSSPMLESEMNKEDENRKEMEAKNKERESIIKNMNMIVQHGCNNKTLPPSPPITPAATSTTANSVEFSSSTCLRDNGSSNNNAAGIINIHSNHSSVTEEPVSPTMCAFDVQSVQQQQNKSEIDKLNQQNTLYMQQQPMQRSIQRLRPAASFATLRQLASTNNTFQYQQQQQQQQQLQQIQKIKRRPVSFIESSSNNMSYFNYAISPPPAANGDDYLTVNNSTVSPVRPTYYRRASSEDNRHFHIRQQSDNNIQTMTYNNIDSRRLVRSNTVHNLIIKDGHGHRIVQCVGGLDQSLPLQRKPSNCENEPLYDWSPPEVIVDEMLFRQQQLEEQQLHQQQLLLIQQHQNQLAAAVATQPDNTNDASSSDSSGSSTNNRRIKRKDSAKSISSLCSGSPPITGYDTKFEKLKTKLEKERATVKALQKQKEACSKDLVFLSKNVDDLTADNAEWKKKFESEKTLKERFQDDLSSTMDKFNEATEHIRQLENQTKALKSEIDDKNKEIRELEKKKQQPTPTTRGGKSSDRVLAAQLQHSQNQVRLLKSTMEQFLRMGVFNDDLNSSLSNLTSPTVSIDAVVSEFKCGGRSKQQQRRNSNHNTSFSFASPTINKSPTAVITTNIAASTLIDENPISTDSNNVVTPTSTAAITLQPPVSTISRKSLVLSENQENSLPNMATKTPEKRLNKQQDELDIELRELLREKELLQAEYSKAPSSGGNAIIRRRREELESRLDTVDSQMCRIKLKMRSRHII